MPEMNMTIAAQIDKVIAENDGSVSAALNMSLADLDIANALLVNEKKKSDALVETLRTIRCLIWPPGPATETERAIDHIACTALRVAGE